MPYTLSGKVQYLLGERNYVIRESIYLEDVTFIVEVQVHEEKAFIKWLEENTNAGIDILPGAYDWIEVKL